MSFSASAPRLSFATEYGASCVEPLHHRRIFFRNTVAIRLRTPGGRNVGGIEQVFNAVGNAVQRAAILPSSDLRIRLFRLRQGMVGGQGDHAAQLGIVLLQAVQINLSEPRGSNFLLLDPLREFRHRRKGNVRIACWQRARVGRAAHEAVAYRDNLYVGQCRVPLRRRSQCWFEIDLTWTSAAFVERGHVRAPTRSNHGYISVCHLDLHQLFRLRHRGGRNLGTYERPGAERRWRTRSGLLLGWHGRLRVNALRDYGADQSGGCDG